MSTDRILIVNQRHLASVLIEDVRHYHQHRPHRALQQQPPEPPPGIINLDVARVRRRPILGGLINEYAQAAQPNRILEPHTCTGASNDLGFASAAPSAPRRSAAATVVAHGIRFWHTKCG